MVRKKLAWPTLAGGGALAATLCEAPAAWACHEDPDVPGYNTEGVSIGLSLGLAFGNQVSVSYGIDLRLHSNRSAAIARVEARNVSALRFIGAAQAVSARELSAEMGLAYHTGRLGTDIDSSLGLHLAFGHYDGGGGLQVAGGVPFLGDLRNYDINSQAILVPDDVKICFASGRRLRRGDTCVLPALALLGDEDCEVAGADAVRRLWLEDVRTECASVPAFQRLVSELRIAGAPRHLVAGAKAAQEDEARHTLLCGRLANVPHWLLPMDPFDAVPRSQVRDEQLLGILAREAWLDGCLGEGIAAACASQAAKSGRGGAADVQGSIARDERRHAELAWSILDWLWRDGGPAVRDAIADLSEQEPELPAVEPIAADPEHLAAAGRLDSDHVREISEREAEQAQKRLLALVG